MSTRRGSYAHRVPEQERRIEKYNEFVTAYFGNKVPETNNKTSKNEQIVFKDGTDPKGQIGYFPSLPDGDVKYNHP